MKFTYQTEARLYSYLVTSKRSVILLRMWYEHSTTSYHYPDRCCMSFTWYTVEVINFCFYLEPSGFSPTPAGPATVRGKPHIAV